MSRSCAETCPTMYTGSTRCEMSRTSEGCLCTRSRANTCGGSCQCSASPSGANGPRDAASSAMQSSGWRWNPTLRMRATDGDTKTGGSFAKGPPAMLFSRLYAARLVELLLLGRAGERGGGGCAAGDHLRDLVEVAGADL